MMPWYSLQYFLPAQWALYDFAYPRVLYVIALLPLLLGLRFLLHRRRQQQLNVSFNAATIDLSGRRGLWSRLVSAGRLLLPLSYMIGVSLVLVALARPQRIREVRESVSEGIDLMLAIDVSESMTATDLRPSRLAAAQRVARTFVASRQSDRIGLVVFAGDAYALVPLTTDYALLQQAVTDLRHGMITTSGTAIGDALARCINRLRETDSTSRPHSRVIVLLSDGDNTAGRLDPLLTAQLAAAYGMRIYSIAIGQPNAGETDEGTLRTIASTTNGSFFRATDARRLQQVFAQISRLERAPVRTNVYQNVQDFYRVYLYWAIAWLLGALLLKNTIFGNILED